MGFGIFKRLPPSLKERIKELGPWRRREAVKLALSSKRIDICAAQFAHVLHLSKNSSLEGKVCLEVGTGWVLSHALVCYLLGAKKVIATDLLQLAKPETLSLSVKNAVAPLPRDILAPFSDHAKIRERFNRLLSIEKFSFQKLEEIGIEYRSPFNFAVEKWDMPVDFIYSFSVMEHVYRDDVPALLRNLVESLNPGGTMIHNIHLEDHQSFERPFDFLRVPAREYTLESHYTRGNRIRHDEWKKIFADLKGTHTDFIYTYSRTDKALPELIDSSVIYRDENDLKVSHIGVYTRKNAMAPTEP